MFHCGGSFWKLGGGGVGGFKSLVHFLWGDLHSINPPRCTFPVKRPRIPDHVLQQQCCITLCVRGGEGAFANLEIVRAGGKTDFSLSLILQPSLLLIITVGQMPNRSSFRESPSKVLQKNDATEIHDTFQQIGQANHHCIGTSTYVLGGTVKGVGFKRSKTLRSDSFGHVCCHLRFRTQFTWI